LLGLRVREVIKKAVEGGHPLPKNAQGSDMCMSYHVKGMCNQNCRRREKASLLSWCALAFAT
jgi:hypothetical protein